MHIPVIRETASNENINLYLLNTEESNFIQNVELDRYSSSYPENVTGWAGGTMITSCISDLQTLNVQIDQRNIMITNETKKVGNIYHPLWYEHKISQIVYNETMEPRSVNRRLTPGTWYISNLIPEEENVVIIKDSVDVYISTETGRIKLAYNEYNVDYMNGRVHIITPYQQRRNEEIVYFITYYIITPNISIEVGNNQADINFRPEYIFTLGNEQKNMPVNSHARNLFYCNILTDKSNMPDIVHEDVSRSYNVVYNSRSRGSVQQESEILKAYPLFVATISDPTYRQYKLDGYNIIVSRSSQDEIYYVKQTSITNDKIYANNRQAYIDELWNININPEQIEIDNTSYRILERDKYKFLSDRNRLVTVKDEIGSLIGPDKILLKNKNIFVDYDKNKTIKNIEIYHENRGEIVDTNRIKDFDKDNGIIHFNNNFSPSDKLRISYTYKTKYVPYNNLQLNPSARFSSTNKYKVNAYSYVIFVLPEYILNPRFKRSIFHFNIIRNQMFKYDNQDYEISASEFMNWAEGVDPQTGLSNIHKIDTIDPKYIKGHIKESVKPLIVAMVTVINTSVASSVNYNDIRIKGGGINPQYDIDKHTEIFTEERNDLYEKGIFLNKYDNILTEYWDFDMKDIAEFVPTSTDIPGIGINDYYEGLTITNTPRNNMDITFLDGEPYPGHNVFIVRIPMSYVYEHINKYYRYNTEIIRMIRNMAKQEAIDNMLESARNKMKETATKFIPASGHIIFEFIETGVQEIEWLEEIFVYED